MKLIDCRGLKCPAPVIKAKKAIEEFPENKLTILVDNNTAKENVLRFLRAQGLQASSSGDSPDIKIVVSVEAANDSEIKEISEQRPGDQFSENLDLILITSEKLGSGSDILGQLLMRSFIYTLSQRTELPKYLVFINSGVKLCSDSSPVLDELIDLEIRGVEILVCGTCTDFLELNDSIKTGRISNMYEISDLLFVSRRIVSL